jgi:hypothetical protein
MGKQDNYNIFAKTANATSISSEQEQSTNGINDITMI